MASGGNGGGKGKPPKRPKPDGLKPVQSGRGPGNKSKRPGGKKR